MLEPGLASLLQIQSGQKPLLENSSISFPHQLFLHSAILIQLNILTHSLSHNKTEGNGMRMFFPNDSFPVLICSFLVLWKYLHSLPKFLQYLGRSHSPVYLSMALNFILTSKYMAGLQNAFAIPPSMCLCLLHFFLFLYHFLSHSTSPSLKSESEGEGTIISGKNDYISRM